MIWTLTFFSSTLKCLLNLSFSPQFKYFFKIVQGPFNYYDTPPFILFYSPRHKQKTFPFFAQFGRFLHGIFQWLVILTNFIFLLNTFTDSPSLVSTLKYETHFRRIGTIKPVFRLSDPRPSYAAVGPRPHKSFIQLNLLLLKNQSLWSWAHYFQLFTSYLNYIDLLMSHVHVLKKLPYC